MTSTEIVARLTEIHADLTDKAARLAAIPSEKARALTNEKTLGALEKEESDVATAIDRLQKRVPLLQESLECSLREEASARLGIIPQEWGGVATQVGGGSTKIREVLTGLLALLERVSTARGRYDALAEEARYLSVRYQLPRVSPPPVEIFASDELKRFVTAATEALKRRSLEAVEWSTQSEALEEQRRQEAQRQEREHPKPAISQIDRSAAALVKAQRDARELEIAKFGLVRAPVIRTRQGFPPEP